MKDSCIVAVVAFAFGTPSGICANEVIRDIARRKAWKANGVVYTQQDVGLLYETHVVFTEEEVGQPPPTLRIARGAVRWAKKHGLEQLWIACAAPHVSRCKRDLEFAVLEAGVSMSVHVCEEIAQHRDHVWFNPDSMHHRTRALELWRLREWILEHSPFSIYKLIAS